MEKMAREIIRFYREIRSPTREEVWMEATQDKLEEDAREGFWAFKACYKKPTSKKINYNPLDLTCKHALINK